MPHLPVHPVDGAKFYVIDVHHHVNDAARIDAHMPPDRVVEVMNNTNVKTIVILTGRWGGKLEAHHRRNDKTLSRAFHGLYPVGL